MASTSFSFPNHITFPTVKPPHSPRHLRVTSAYATAETDPKTASFYDVLGIQTGASIQEIKSAYRRLARVLHPDVAPRYGADDRAPSAEEFMRLHAAYATLSDPEKRAVYDSSLFRRRRRPEMSRRVRSWETDQCW